MFEGILNMLLPKSKANVSCPKRTLDAIKYNVNVRDMFWNISIILVNIWLRNVQKYMNQFCSTTFLFNCFEVRSALSFWFFLVEDYLLLLIFKLI